MFMATTMCHNLAMFLTIKYWCVSSSRIHDTDLKYYANGEDAYEMRKELSLKPASSKGGKKAAEVKSVEAVPVAAESGGSSAGEAPATASTAAGEPVAPVEDSSSKVAVVAKEAAVDMTPAGPNGERLDGEHHV